MAVEGLRTPVGRIVWGNPAKSQIKKDPRTKQPILRDGKQVEQWAFGVAFAKAEFMQFMKPYFDQEAATAYPNGVPQGFSWKYKDGDGVDRKGQPYSAREGWAGCIVLTVSTEAFAPPIWKEINGAYYQVAAEEIKTGDYVALNLNLKVNTPQSPTHTPGLYVNPNGIILVGQGTPIMNSADPDDMFGGQSYQLPPGATPLGQAPQQQPGAMPGQMPGMPAQQPQTPQQMPGQAPMGGYQQPPMQQPGYPAQQPAQQPYQPQQQPGQMPPPHQQFVQPGAPVQPPMQPQTPQQMPGQAPQYQQPGYPAQPGQMPGMPGPR